MGDAPPTPDMALRTQARLPAGSSKPSGSDVQLLAILSSEQRLVVRELGGMLPRGPAATLGPRIRDYFRDVPLAPLLAGALPFDRGAPDYLVAAARVGAGLPEPRAGRLETDRRWWLRPEPPVADYAATVARALEVMAGEPRGANLRKIVLARSLLAVSDRPIDIIGLLHRLHADASATAFLVPLPAGPDSAPRYLVGATPELLVARAGRKVVSHPLAGSARREAESGADEAARASLLASEKDRREHALVAEFVMDVLAPHCRTLAAPDGRAIRSTRSMWHLGTRIEGELRDPDLSAADLAAMLHPTPAVCGTPRERAAALIPELEQLDRGFYAGAIGWCDRAGDGAWHVSVRCAEVSGCHARLYAGAGIVPGSRPDAEAEETAAKFRAMLQALGADEWGDRRVTTAGFPRIPPY